ncbi:MAG TPA: SDR family oxidoreductase [Pyrinomonadaceae bacterium]|jgi:thioester reductase-like protein
MTGQTIFLTGFPGFIAGRLVAELARGGARFLLLVQPALRARAERDVARLAAETDAPAARFRLLAGDITQPQLGLAPDALAAARAETTHLFHLAAAYDLGVAPDLAQRVNVEGTRRVNEFARALPRLRRYDYVSTCYVAGRRTGLIYETELEHDAGFRNHYEATKYAAEVEVERLKAELPVTIYRPAVVCGDSRTGETAKYDGVYYLINYLRKAPRLLALANIGNRSVRLNVVPVDFVVRALAALAADERATRATVQLADPAPLTTYELFETIAQALARRGSLFQVPPALVHASLLLPVVAEPITGLPRVAVPYFFIEQTYDTTRAQALLAPHGVACPPFPAYVRALLAYVAQHPRL